MVKNGPKMAEIILGASPMLNNNIFNIFSFSTFFFCTVKPLYFVRILRKKLQKTGSKKYLKEKVEKTKDVKNVIIDHMKLPK